MKETVEKQLRESRQPYMNMKLLCTRMPSFQKYQIRACLNELEREGKVYFSKESGYALCSRLGIVSGTVVKVAGKFGFAQLDDEEGTQVFIPGRFLMGAMAGEKVLLKTRPSRTGQSLEGEVLHVTPDPDGGYIGVLHQAGQSCWVVLDSMPKTDIQVRPSSVGTAKDGDKVMVKLAVRGKSHFSHVAEVVTVFGDSKKAKNCCDAILVENKVKLDFDEATLQEAAAVGERGVDPADFAGREDLRDWCIFTIDSKETKDIDDAISFRQVEGGFELGVHIADVSHYVKRGSALDAEAFERGTSVYYANAVVPMLPVELSNGVCSLNPDEDRLALSCICKMAPSGEILDYRIAKTVIRSCKKCAYSEVNALLDGTATPEVEAAYAQVKETLLQMGAFGKVLEARRFGRGAMNIESMEAKIVIDENGDPVDILVRDRGDSEKMIEEFMLTANEAVARFGREKQLPFVYRVHEDPDPERLEVLQGIVKAFGHPYLKIKAGAPSKVLADVLDATRGKPEQILIHKMVLRSMAKAKYAETPLGHYSLSLHDYTHFTSPIRRYPDLSIHRILTDYLDGVPAEEIKKRYGEFVKEAALQSTNREIGAMLAERSCDDAYKAQYMERFVGQELDGIISGVASYGFYVQLPNTAEGLVRLATIENTDFELSEDGTKLVEERTGHTLRIGDPVRVKVRAVNVSLGQVDFDLAK
ncbi:ribonuclease R [Bittarella massiliensis (ex Durand et al. 2017)]|uniref:Ribonuclease R n=1 Tax=Bittarella massiliensis (ex Durand et al. 2017) TaxID=1720313 RepID=A0AAW5KID0_9FIRM|nr:MULTISPECIES: ribonuclease R [Oscillospiraceae]MCQ4950454.1 ribonuclease R [Bittarella massiliensis (ex Durand et al. 2017)]